MIGKCITLSPNTGWIAKKRQKAVLSQMDVGSVLCYKQNLRVRWLRNLEMMIIRAYVTLTTWWPV